MPPEKVQKTKIDIAIDDTNLRLNEARRKWQAILVEIETLEKQLRTLELIRDNEDYK